MKNYHEMSDYEINVAVAKLVIWKNKDCEDVSYNNNLSKVSWGDGANWREFDSCNNPYDAYEIILQTWDRLMAPVFDLDGAYICAEWQAAINFSLSEPNPLRAAMIVFLMMKEKEKN